MYFLGQVVGGRLFARSVFSGATLFVAALASATAVAQVPCGGKTCPKGFVCEVESGGCPDIGCTGDCPPCENNEVEVCEPGPCTSDADCDAELRCAESRRGPGPGSNCAGPDCAEVPEAGETRMLERLCLPKWALTCSADADCGEGFKCIERRAGCSDGSPPSGSPGSTPAMSGSGAEQSRECEEKTGEMRCEGMRIACTAAAGASDPACPAGWTCRDNPEGASWSDANGNMGCEPGDPPKLCFPRYAEFGFVGRSATSDESTSGSTEGRDVAIDKLVDEGGCAFSVSSKASTGWAPAALLALAAFAGRRRRTSGSS